MLSKFQRLVLTQLQTGGKLIRTDGPNMLTRPDGTERAIPLNTVRGLYKFGLIEAVGSEWRLTEHGTKY